MLVDYTEEDDKGRQFLEMHESKSDMPIQNHNGIQPWHKGFRSIKINQSLYLLTAVDRII